MKMIIEEIGKTGILPNFKAKDIKEAESMIKAFYDQNILCIEVTLSEIISGDFIENMKHKFPGMIIGIKDISSLNQADKALRMGARFVSSTSFNLEIASFCMKNNLPYIPECSKISEVVQAITEGFDLIKIFVTESTNLLEKVRDLNNIYSNVNFILSRGIDANNLSGYLSIPNVLACSGDWMLDGVSHSKTNFAHISDSIKYSIDKMLGFELCHLGINSIDESEANEISDEFSEVFSFPKKIGESSIFAGQSFEIMKFPFLGEKGHIAISTNNINRAMYFIQRKGYKFKDETKNYKDGKLKTIYLEKEIGGFAIHLFQK